MGRRRKGHKRFKDGRWIVELAGEYLGSFATEAEADLRIAAAFVEANPNKRPDALSLFADEWIEKRELAARARKRGRPFEKELSVWNTHVRSAPFYDWPFKRLKPKVIQEWVHEVAGKNAVHAMRVKVGREYVIKRRTTERRVGRRTPENALKMLKLCLDDAIIAGKLAPPNPARLVKLPREEVPELDGQLIRHLTREEIAKLFAAPLPPLQRAVFAVAVFAGLRLDEVWGMRWQDVTLDGRKPEIRVRRSYDGPVKTRNSLRDVPLLPPALDALRAWRASQASVPIAGLVFPADGGGCHSDSYTAGWRDKPQRDKQGELVVRKGWATRAGIRSEVDFRDLRHTCGCHLAQGTWTRPFTLHEIKRWLGHSSIAVTERHYAALTSDNLHNAVSDHRFSGNKAETRDDHT